MSFRDPGEVLAFLRSEIEVYRRGKEPWNVARSTRIVLFVPGLSS